MTWYIRYFQQVIIMYFSEFIVYIFRHKRIVRTEVCIIKNLIRFIMLLNIHRTKI